MTESFQELLAVGGTSNSLGRSNEVIEKVLADKTRLDELYGCLFVEDAWVRMRAADALEKVCRVHPDWLEPYVDKLLTEVSRSSQPSIRWHLAQMYGEIDLTDTQKRQAVDWLKDLLASPAIDWIVAANAMETLVGFTEDGSVSSSETIPLLKVQRQRKSKAVVRRADKLLAKLMN